LTVTLDPSDHTVADLEDALVDVENPDDLRDILAAEEDGKDRKTAREAIEKRLAAVAEAFGHDVGEGRLPPKVKMRAAILRASGVDEDAAPADCENAFRKAELEAIAAALGDR
jgi:hypothetical protein